MELTRENIKKVASWEAMGVKVPTYDMPKIIKNTSENPVWIHFGAGNIFRIFIGSIVDALIHQQNMETGIICVEGYDVDIIDDIYTPYDNLVLGVTLQADGHTKKQVIGSLIEGLKTTEDCQRVKEIFTNPSLQIVSLTITEKGYALADTNGSYFPWILEDFEKGPQMAQSTMTILCQLLYERYQTSKTPIALVSMDNCSHNGEKLQKAILTIAKEWLQRGYVEAAFLTWLEDKEMVSFPWTMIDKITPRPALSIARELEDLGISNMQPIITSKNTYIAPFVNAEGPQYLVIEDCFPNGRPPLEKAGVYLCDRDTVNKVERMKVTTCLNPLHTALALYGCMLGYDLIAQEMKDPDLQQLVNQIGPKEGMPVVVDPKILSPEAFVKEVIEVRLPNPFMPDSPQRIACDTSQKVGIRFGETIKSYTEKYGDAKMLVGIPLAIAGWCRYLLAIDDKGNPFTLSSDPMLEELQTMLQGVVFKDPTSYTGQLHQLLENKNIFGINLYEAGIGEFIEKIFVEQIQGPGAIRKTLQKYLSK